MLSAVRINTTKTKAADPDSHQFGNRLRIRIKVKSRIRICIEVKSRIRDPHQSKKPGVVEAQNGATEDNPGAVEVEGGLKASCWRFLSH
jgi:hypothetical protein